MKRNNSDVVVAALGQRLRHFRTDAGLSPADLSGLSGVDAAKIEEVEKGAGDLAFTELVGICKVLHISLGKFTDYSFGMEQRTILRNESLMQAFLNLLNGFAPVSELPLPYLEKIIKVKHIENNDFLLRSGDICRNIYFLQSGVMRMSCKDGTMPPYSYFVVEGGFFVDAQSFLKQKPGKMEVQAVHHLGSVVYYITHQEWLFLCNQNAVFRQRSKVLFEACVQAESKFKELNKLEKGKDRANWVAEHCPEWLVRVPLSRLAMGLKTSVESLRGGSVMAEFRARLLW